MSNDKTYSARLTTGTANTIQEYSLRPQLLNPQHFSIILKLFKAHAAMLAGTGIIARQDAAAILHELIKMEQDGFDQFPMRLDHGDIYLNLQMLLMKNLGNRVGGWLHIAISRNDFYMTETRLYTRELINQSIDSMLTLMEAVLKLASGHVDTVMPGFTHSSQPAQPLTLAHFLLAHYDAFARDVERFEQAYAVVNQSAMGGCALATTGFPIDRQRVSDLIGCNQIVENSLDATGGRDVIMQTGTTATIALSTMGRLTESLLLWNTIYFGMVELADQYCGISSLMPQKKNPIGLEMIRAESVCAHNLVNGAFGILKALPTCAGYEASYIDAQIFEATEKLIVWARVLAEILDSLKIKVDVMLKKAGEGFSAMTELADTIVRNTELSYHEAYLLVSRLVAKALAAGLDAEAITSEMIDEIAVDLYQKPLKLGAEVVKQALDPMENVKMRDRIGGPAPAEVRRMLGERVKQQAALRTQLEDQLEELEKAEAWLDRAVKGITGIK